jgi:hypothetical protein
MAETTANSTTANSTTATPAQKAATTRKTNATKRSTAAKKGAATRSATRGAAARSTATRKTKATVSRAETSAAKKAAAAKAETKSTVGRAAEYAEKAVLVPVGATLMARDAVIETVEDLRAKYSTRTKAEQQLRRFERRGSSAVKGIERDAKKTRTRIERELKKVRKAPVVKNAELVTARVENAVQTGRTAATKASTTVQERIASLA